MAMRSTALAVVTLLGLLLPAPGFSQDIVVEDATPGSEDDVEEVGATGRIIVMTRPSHALVQLDGQPAYQLHPNRPQTLLERRTRTEFNGVGIYDDHSIWIELPNFRGRRVLLPAFGSEGSRWERYGDDYVVNLNEELVVVAECADEMNKRLAAFDCAEESECQVLTGTITVRSHPTGASIRYAGELLVDDAGDPLTTPATFSHFPSSDDGSPVPVTLQPGGVPLQLELLGFHTMITGVFPQMFRCVPEEHNTPIETSDCDYTYDTGQIELYEPEDWEAGR